MGKENKEYIKDLVYFSTIGLQVAFAIIIGYLVGQFLDDKFNTYPWLTYIFLVFGIIAGFKNLGLAIKKVQKADREGKY